MKSIRPLQRTLLCTVASLMMAVGASCWAASAKTAGIVPHKPAAWIDVRKLVLEPTVATIVGTGNRHRFLATASFADGSERDVTEQVSFSVDSPEVLRSVSPGLFEARREGISKLRATLGGHHSESVVVV